MIFADEYFPRISINLNLALRLLQKHYLLLKLLKRRPVAGKSWYTLKNWLYSLPTTRSRPDGDILTRVIYEKKGGEISKRNLKSGLVRSWILTVSLFLMLNVDPAISFCFASRTFKSLFRQSQTSLPRTRIP